MNIFATILTYPAPSANYRGESEQNRSVIQKVTQGRFEYAIMSPEAMRNALREMLRCYGLQCNRERLHNEEQLAVSFEDYPDPDKYADDFLFGYMVAKREQVPKKVISQRGGFQFKRDSVLRMNLAKALQPYRHDAVFTQSPLTVKNPNSPWQNATTSAPLHREMSLTAFQYPFAINLNDCCSEDSSQEKKRKEWLRYLLKGISELNGVAGNHARSYFEMAPASIVIRLSDSVVAGYDTYGFREDGSFPEVVDGILHDDYPGKEFYFGGQIVKQALDDCVKKQLEEKSVNLFRMAYQTLDAVAETVTGQGFASSAL